MRFMAPEQRHGQPPRISGPARSDLLRQLVPPAATVRSSILPDLSSSRAEQRPAFVDPRLDDMSVSEIRHALMWFRVLSNEGRFVVSHERFDPAQHVVIPQLSFANGDAIEAFIAGGRQRGLAIVYATDRASNIENPQAGARVSANKISDPLSPHGRQQEYRIYIAFEGVARRKNENWMPDFVVGDGAEQGYFEVGNENRRNLNYTDAFELAQIGPYESGERQHGLMIFDNGEKLYFAPVSLAMPKKAVAAPVAQIPEARKVEQPVLQSGGPTEQEKLDAITNNSSLSPDEKTLALSLIKSPQRGLSAMKAGLMEFPLYDGFARVPLGTRQADLHGARVDILPKQDSIQLTFHLDALSIEQVLKKMGDYRVGKEELFSAIKPGKQERVVVEIRLSGGKVEAIAQHAKWDAASAKHVLTGKRFAVNFDAIAAIVYGLKAREEAVRIVYESQRHNDPSGRRLTRVQSADQRTRQEAWNTRVAFAQLDEERGIQPGQTRYPPLESLGGTKKTQQRPKSRFDRRREQANP